jgi:hypothetical protein
MRIGRLSVTLALCTAALGVLPQQVRANDPEPLTVQCLCRDGSSTNRFFGRFAVDAGSSQALKDLIEANTFGLRRTITIRGEGCGRDPRLEGLNATCGRTSVTNRDPAGRLTESTMVDNAEFSGEVTMRITSNSGIPRLPGTPDDEPRVNMEQWTSGRVRVIQVMGVAQKVTPK